MLAVPPRRDVLRSSRGLILAGFLLLLTSWGLIFAMVLHLIPSPLWLSAVTFFGSVGGLFLGVLGAALYVAENRHPE
ncbi:MAG: hypothetical protein PHV11_02660 [Candidatus Bipolaricaulis sp.]|nr:hypothetical protein [Candidatus Bipolaricaulis sp.]